VDGAVLGSGSARLGIADSSVVVDGLLKGNLYLLLPGEAPGSADPSGRAIGGAEGALVDAIVQGPFDFVAGFTIGKVGIGKVLGKTVLGAHGNVHPIVSVIRPVPIIASAAFALSVLFVASARFGSAASIVFARAHARGLGSPTGRAVGAIVALFQRGWRIFVMFAKEVRKFPLEV
jgi:hypothetical protein